MLNLHVAFERLAELYPLPKSEDELGAVFFEAVQHRQDPLAQGRLKTVWTYILRQVQNDKASIETWYRLISETELQLRQLQKRTPIGHTAAAQGHVDALTKQTGFLKARAEPTVQRLKQAAVAIKVLRETVENLTKEPDQ